MTPEILNAFEGIGIDGLNRVALLNRKDSKYLFNVGRLQELLNELAPHYDILDIDGMRMFKYRNMYYDTAGFDLYRYHHNGKRNRYKVRAREYADTGQCFNEIKFKNNKSATVKSRLKRSRFSRELDRKFTDFITISSTLRPDELRPVLSIEFSRLTLAQKDGLDRVTIDTGLLFGTADACTTVEHLGILELKQDRNRHRSYAKDTLRDLRIKQSGCSKYCLGITHMYPDIKQNNLKKLRRKIDKLNA